MHIKSNYNYQNHINHQLVDIGIGFFFDHDAIKIIKNNSWFRMIGPHGKYTLIKPQVSIVFKYYL